jgi:hypothetical protein
MERASGRGPLAPDSRGLPTPKGTVNRRVKTRPLPTPKGTVLGGKRFKEGTINIVLSYCSSIVMITSANNLHTRQLEYD